MERFGPPGNATERQRTTRNATGTDRERQGAPGKTRGPRRQTRKRQGRLEMKKKPRTGSSRRQVLFKTLQTMQSNEMTKRNRTHNAKERQQPPGNARESKERQETPGAPRCANNQKSEVQETGYEETLQSVQSVELFNLNKAPKARKNPKNQEVHNSRKCLILT